MTELLRSLPPEENYSIHTDEKYRSRIKLFAPHGGCIEPCTAPVALTLAEGLFDSFVFYGSRKKDCFKMLHVTSIHYDEPACMRMISNAELGIAIHGCAGDETFLEIGGMHIPGRKSFESTLVSAGYIIRSADEGRRGEANKNFINMAKKGGIQIEMSAGFRKMLFPGYPRSVTRHPVHFSRFIHICRTWLREVELCVDRENE
jgi:phage replication-related protein YjqB (UPF0714/DUF867 family)